MTERQGQSQTSPDRVSEVMVAASPASFFWSKRKISIGLTYRAALFLVLCLAEWIALARLTRIRAGGRSMFDAGIVFASVFLALVYAKAGKSLRPIAREIKVAPIGWRYVAGHAASILAFIGVTRFTPPGVTPAVWEFYTIAAASYATGIAAVGLAASALAPPKLIRQAMWATRVAWYYSLPIGIVAWRLMSISPLLGDYLFNGPFWRPAADFTFFLVKSLLHVFLPHVVADRATMTVGSPNFLVSIRPGCTGWEGTALMLVFSVAWLFVLRREFRFPRAALLIPGALATMWLSNSVRIAVLVLIGAAGAPGVAMDGFHSQAGWIAFNCVALGFAITSREISWLRVQRPERPYRKSLASSTTAAHLVPFLAILAAGMLSHAVASGFEWMYPLRLAAAAAMLWVFRSQYREMKWRFGWPALLLGSAVFVMWVGVNLFSGGVTANQGSPAELAQWPVFARIVWLVCRVAAAVITVPLAEELAFRGFLIRRVISSDFDSIDARRFTVFSIVISSFVFGLLHGSQWVAGTIAGLLYAAAFLRRGSIGDAVVAHSTTNALLAGLVLWSGNWSWW